MPLRQLLTARGVGWYHEAERRHDCVGRHFVTIVGQNKTGGVSIPTRVGDLRDGWQLRVSVPDGGGMTVATVNQCFSN